eukprot:1683087-Amphidinium_carterae.1
MSSDLRCLSHAPVLLLKHVILRVRGPNIRSILQPSKRKCTQPVYGRQERASDWPWADWARVHREASGARKGFSDHSAV